MTSPLVTTTETSDPINTFRAASVSEMYDWVPTYNALQWTYDIGLPIQIQPINYVFRNKSTNTSLRFQFTIPSFALFTGTTDIVLAPLQQYTCKLGLKESWAALASVNNQVVDQFKWRVTPLNVSGPVYIQNNLPSLTASNPDANQNPYGETSGNRDYLYLDIKPYTEGKNNILTLGEDRLFVIDAWLSSVANPAPGQGLKLIFGNESVIWSSENYEIVDVVSPEGTSVASVAGLSRGAATLRADIVKPPSNVTLTEWQTLYQSKTGITGGVRSTSVNGNASAFTVYELIEVRE